MFYNCHNFNQPLEKWNISNIKDMAFMFKSCRKFNQHLGNWKICSNKTSNIRYMFEDCNAIYV